MTKSQLIKRRKDLGMSQLKLARLAGVSRFNISLCETGNRKLNLVELSKIKKVFKKEEAKLV